jgi:hypothetical protein
MKVPSIKILFTWNLVLTTLLLVMIGITAVSVQAANDPPVKVYSANLDHNSGTNGTGTTVNKVINGTGWQTILSVPVDFTGQTHNHHCVVIGTANAVNPAGGGNTGFRYDFSTRLDGGGGSSWALMTLELSDNPSHDDANFVPVTISRLWTELEPGAHTLDFIAREQNAGNPNLTITNATVSALCFKRLQIPASGMQPAEPDMDTDMDMSNDK